MRRKTILCDANILIDYWNAGKDAIRAACLFSDPGCSVRDTVCFLLAKENGWTCATNDGKLRKECTRAGVEVIRGLGLLLEIVRNKCLTNKKAAACARNMAEKNREITSEILQKFLKSIDENME